MSFLGSVDSSAASGNCSMARNSQTAKGKLASTPAAPSGNQPPPPSGNSASVPSGAVVMFNAQRPRSKYGIALTQYTASTASAPKVTITETLNDSSTPRRLSNKNTA